MTDFIRYYIAYKHLHDLHVELKYGKHPDVPQGFSERLCRRLCGLGKSKEHAFDASSEGKQFEIKATGDSVGKTTIDLKDIRSVGNKFGGLKWLYLDISRDEVHVVHIPPGSFKDRIAQLDEGKERESITLSKLSSEAHDVYVIDVETCTIAKK